MPQFRLSHIALSAALLFGLNATPLFVATAHAESASPDVSKKLSEANGLMKSNPKGALAKIHELDGGSHTAYDTYLIEATRASAAQLAGDNATAAKSYEAVINSGRVTGANQAKMVLVLGQIYFRAGEYTKSIVWLQRYQSESGDNSQRPYLIQAYYFSGKIAEAYKETKADIAAEEKAGRTPTGDQLDMYLNCAQKMNDKAEYLAALEKVAAYRPTKEVWAALMGRLENKNGFANSRLHLDVLRLRMQLNALTTAADYTDYLELLIQANLPGEAKKAVDAAYKAGVFGDGKEAARQKRLQDRINTDLAADPKRVADAAAKAEADKNGDDMLAAGYDLVTTGQADKGLTLMEKGIAAGNLKHPDDAKLHLGIAYVLAGKKPKAIATFKTVAGTDGTTDLAHYWTMVTNHPVN